MPSIADVVDSIGELLAAYATPIPVKLGEEYVNENGTPPNVVFVPGEDRFEPARSRNRDRLHPSIATRSVALEARIWGAGLPAVEADPDADPPVEAYDPGSYPDIRATELLVDRVLLALQTTCGGSMRLEGGNWLPASPSIFGRIYVLRCRVEIPVVPTEDEAESLVTTWTEVLSAETSVDPEFGPAITSTVELGDDNDETGVPSP